jgi:hypothetical protein
MKLRISSSEIRVFLMNTCYLISGGDCKGYLSAVIGSPAASTLVPTQTS